MTKLILDISMSLDGFIAGPDPSPDQPLGAGGEQLHEWVYGLASWRESHGRPGGETGPDDDLARAHLEGSGAAILGRNMFGGGTGPWDESWKGWWGDDPPFKMPVFIVTHHEREPLEFENGTSFTFVTDGIESALEQAKSAAGAGKHVGLGGGADIAQQYLNAGLVDEAQLHVVPVFLGGGIRLLDGLNPRQLELVRVVDSPAVTHLRYRAS